MKQKVNLLIGTPAYNSQVHTDYVQSVMSFFLAGIEYSVLTIGNESLITRARNTIISKFYQLEDFTHLLFLDGDVFLDGKDLVKLVDHDKDVIGAPVPLKTIDEQGKKTFNLGQLLEQDDSLCKTNYLGTAVMMLSRKAANSLIEDAQKENRCYKANPRGSSDPNPGEQFDVFRVGVVEGEYLSEDFWICHQLRSFGFDVFVDTSIKIRHNGMYQF